MDRSAAFMAMWTKKWGACAWMKVLTSQSWMILFCLVQRRDLPKPSAYLIDVGLGLLRRMHKTHSMQLSLAAKRGVLGPAEAPFNRCDWAGAISTIADCNARCTSADWAARSPNLIGF
jgi:hypothetical protein